MSAIGAETRVALTYYWRCRFKAEIEFGTQRILLWEVSKSTLFFNQTSLLFQEKIWKNLEKSNEFCCPNHESQSP